jgi:hypothetical protein
VRVEIPCQRFHVRHSGKRVGKLNCFGCILVFTRTHTHTAEGLEHSHACVRTRGGSFNIVTTLRAGRPVLESWQGLGFFLISTASILAPGPTQPPLQKVLGALSPGWRCQGVKLTTYIHLVPRLMRGAIPPLLLYFMLWHLVKHRKNFTCVAIQASAHRYDCYVIILSSIF